MKGTHCFPVRVYYEDTDAGGIVYYANYLKFTERARTEALRACGIEQRDLWQEHQVGFAVRTCNVEFLKPAKLDDLLTIETRLHDISKVSLDMHQTIRRDESILVTLAVKLAVIGSGMKPVKLPEFVKKALLQLFSHP